MSAKGFHRAIRIQASPGYATSEVEDDFHHFAVTVAHDGARVTEVTGRAWRYPWSSCPLAAGALEALRGLPIDADPTAIYRYADPLSQCTHMFEMAGLAVTQAARGTGPRRYDAFVADPAEGRQIAELLCDGERILAWVLEDGVIAEPAEHRGRKPSNFRSRGLAEISPAAAEAILLLRRAVMAAKARGADIDQYPTAADVSPGGACFVFRPGVAELARRRYGSVSDFSAGLGPLPDARGAEP